MCRYWFHFLFAEENDKEKPTPEKTTTTPSSSQKRPREEKIDPSKAPDPEEPEKYDSEKFQSEADQGFKLPEDENVVTLDPCEWEGMCDSVVCVCEFEGLHQVMFSQALRKFA